MSDEELDLDQLSGETDDDHEIPATDESADITDELNDGEPGDGEDTTAKDDESGSVADTDAGSAGEGIKEGQTVPLAVLLDERRNFQERIDTMNQNLGKFQGLQDKVDGFLANKKAEAEAVPETEYLDDPKGYIDEQVGKAEAASKETAANVTNMREGHEAQSRMQQINARLGAIDADFVKDNNDYYDALEHVRRVNIENGMDMGMTKEQASGQAAQAMLMTQAQVMQKGVNPAEYMYKMAKRWGYAAKVADPTDTKDKNDDVIIAGQEAGSMGGGEAPGEKDHDDDEMSDSEFAEIMTGEFGAQFVR